MKWRTEMMEAILTSEMAQKIIDYVSPIYGDSYVGLWIFQAIGSIMGEVYDMAAALRYEANPSTATLLLDYWEDQYGLARDSSLTTEQRRLRIIAKMQGRYSCNPARLAAAVSSALGGAEVGVNEHVAKNTFQVVIRDAVKSYAPAVETIDTMKPAHLIYWIKTEAQTEAPVKVAVAVTHKPSYHLEVSGYGEDIRTSLSVAVAMTEIQEHHVEVHG